MERQIGRLLAGRKRGGRVKLRSCVSFGESEGWKKPVALAASGRADGRPTSSERRRLLCSAGLLEADETRRDAEVQREDALRDSLRATSPALRGDLFLLCLSVSLYSRPLPQARRGLRWCWCWLSWC